MVQWLSLEKVIGLSRYLMNCGVAGLIAMISWCELLGSPSEEVGVAAEDDVDYLGGILRPVLLVLALFLVLVKRWGVDRPLEVVALDNRVLGVWVPWALLLQKLHELLLRCG